jgi:hypothetical protein
MLSDRILLILRVMRGDGADQTGSRQAEGVTQEGSSTGRW